MNTRRVNLSKFYFAHGGWKTARMKRGEIDRKCDIIWVSRDHWRRVMHGYRPPSRGFGDWIEAVTIATGIKWLTAHWERITHIPCGCDRRQNKLNRAWHLTRQAIRL